MTRRDIALYKLASFSQKMQKRAEGGPGYWDAIKGNAGTLGALGLAGLLGGRMFGGENKGKRGFLGMIGLPSLYALYLAGKKGGLLGDKGYSGWAPLDATADVINSATNAGVDAIKRHWPSSNASS